MKTVKLPTLIYKFFALRFAQEFPGKLPWDTWDGSQDGNDGTISITFLQENNGVEETLQKVYHDFHDSDWKGWMS